MSSADESSTGFTFLNTNESKLSQPASKRMRAHITKANFAKRRQRLSKDAIQQNPTRKPTTLPEDEPETRKRKSQTLATHNNPSLSDISNLLISNRDIKAFHELQELVFLQGRHGPDTPSEAAWFNLVASEPALLEASMAVAVRQWSPDELCQLKADRHSSNAVKILTQVITSTQARTDGVLAAILTMALGASLASDDIAWKVHINGLCRIVQDRGSFGRYAVPIFGFPRVYHESIIHSLSWWHDARILKIPTICDRVIQLRKLIDSHHQYHFDDTFVAREIEEPLAKLHYEARDLRDENNSQIDSVGRTIELILYLLWPSQSAAHLTLLAEELKGAICRYPFKRCVVMDLTSFQLMIGALAADKGSDTRMWFMDKISMAVQFMQVRGWERPLEILERRSLLEAGLMDRFRGVWQELQCQ
ncbi:hypothetical protein N7478_007532 [Penicillium angulare]|uniref:uncharacterized protein n=1 Tax=Penicillium angulare TaxID=116970 RepID=UPI0025422CBE|nr:uncharacterized protein N7478_007532 [Penicillium angulare]KAJ5272407.1 hypothetical protein N7478_007532 [Penicillium angulare]